MRCRGVALRADAAREDTEEALGIMESRLDRAEHNIQLLQHAVHQHDERIVGFMYSPARNSVAVRAPIPARSLRAFVHDLEHSGRYIKAPPGCACWLWLINLVLNRMS